MAPIRVIRNSDSAVAYAARLSMDTIADVYISLQLATGAPAGTWFIVFADGSGNTTADDGTFASDYTITP